MSSYYDDGITFAQLAGAIDRAPVRVQRRGNVIRATLTLPAGPGGAMRTYRAHVRMGDELGWFGSKFARKLKRGAVGKLARGIARAAKRIAKSKVLRAAWKSLPMWANLVPPPIGQAIAAGAAGAQTAMKVLAAAKRGHKGAIAFIKGARKLRRAKVASIVRAKKVAQATRALPAPQRRAAVTRAMNETGVYVVRTPAGRIVQIPADRVRL